MIDHSRLSLASQERMDKVKSKRENVEKIKSSLNEEPVFPDQINPFLEKFSSSPINEKQRISKLLLRPGIELADLIDFLPALNDQLKNYSPETIEQASIHSHSLNHRGQGYWPGNFRRLH